MLHKFLIIGYDDDCIKLYLVNVEDNRRSVALSTFKAFSVKEGWKGFNKIEVLSLKSNIEVANLATLPTASPLTITRELAEVPVQPLDWRGPGIHTKEI